MKVGIEIRELNCTKNVPLRPVVGRDGAAGAAVAPIALSADVGAAGVDEGGAPGLVVGEVCMVPCALAVHHAVDLEGEDARLPF